MEIRAPYALIGLFVLTVIVAAFGFVYWLHNTGDLDRANDLPHSLRKYGGRLVDWSRCSFQRYSRR